MLFHWAPQTKALVRLQPGIHAINSPKSNPPWPETRIGRSQRQFRSVETPVRFRPFYTEDALLGVEKDDLVFLDPPYVTRHNNNGFVDYNELLFSWDDQVRLAELAIELAARGAHVIVTNAYHHDVLNLYRGFAIEMVTRHSTVASNKDFRGRVSEAVMYSQRLARPLKKTGA